MANKNSEKEFNELVTSFFQGRMSRRRFIRRAAQLGLSAASGESARNCLFRGR